MRKNIFCVMLLCVTLILNSQNLYSESENKSASSILSLEEAVALTLTQNPELKSMQKGTEASKAKVPQARSWDDTQMGVRFFEVPFNQGITAADDIDYIVSQKIPFPGKKKAASQAVYHEYLHHLEDLNARGRELLREVKSTYFNLFALQRQIEQFTKIESLLKGLIQSAQSKLSTGQGMAIDAIQGQAELAKFLVEKESLIQKKKILEARLNQLMARPVDEAIRLPLKLEVPKWEVKLEDLMEIAQTRQPSIRLTEHDIGEKQWRIKAAKREFLPDLNAQLEYLQKPGPREDAWTGQFLINVPLMVKKKRAAVAQAEAELAQAQYQNLSAKNEVAYKIKEAYIKMKTADRILQINQSILVPQTRQNYEATTLAYSTGKAPFLNSLLAARSFLDSQMEYWKSYEALGSSISELEEAVGATREELIELKISKSISDVRKNPETKGSNL